MTVVAAMSVGVIWAAPRQGIPSGCDPASMSDAYWKIWNAEEQAKIDADIEANRKADAVVAVPVGDGAEVTVEQLDHDFRFGAHIFNFNQLGKKEYNDAYKASYGKGGLFNQATVAYYWKDYEPVPGRLRAGGDYEDTERFWNSLSREEAMEHPFWRRPSAGPVVDFLRAKDVRIHGHILVWGLAKPDWIYDWYCPENEKRAFDKLGIPRHSEQFAGPGDWGWSGTYNAQWRAAWGAAYTEASEQEIAAMAPTFTKEMRRIFRKRVFDVAAAFGPVNDSWDVVNESSTDWAVYRKSRTGLPVWKSCYGLMPGDYPLHALLDAKEAFPASAKLAINDWNVAQDFQSQVHDLEREGAKIDIVGCQMHLFDTNECARLAKGETGIKWISTPGDIQKNLDMMAELGRPLHVSEITITSPGADEKSRQIQAFLTRNIYRKWFSHKGMMGITWWNTVDGGGVKGEPLVSGLFTRDMKKKPAYLALDELINKEWKTRLSVKAEVENGMGKVKFRGFRGKYRISWTCPRCGGRHSREVYVLGDGLVETKKLTVDDTCLRCVRNFTVDGKEHVLSPNEMSLDLAKLYPSGAGKDGYDGKQWAKVGFTLVAPKAGVYKLMVHADYYGKFSVNGVDPFDFNGPWRGYLPVELTLKEGKNDILYSSRAGSSGKWDVTFRLPSGSSLMAL